MTKYLVLDSLEKQLDIFKENERDSLVFKQKFQEKDSLMIIEFQKNYEKTVKILQNSCYLNPEIEKLKEKLLIEQNRIMKFEASVNNADSVLKLESRKWVRDYIVKEIRFYAYSKKIKPLILTKQPIYVDKRAESLNFNTDLIDFINNGAWKEEYIYHFNFIKNKVLFDFNLE